MILTVESVGPSKSGKALRVSANGKWYGANKDSGITQGMVIDAEVSDGKFGLWIDKYAKSNGSADQQVSPKTQVERSGATNSPSAGAAPVWLPFASNTVAHAINGGLITKPEDVKLWAAAAKQAYTELA